MWVGLKVPTLIGVQPLGPRRENGFIYPHHSSVIPIPISEQGSGHRAVIKLISK